MNVLLVDDNEANRQTLLAELRALPITATAVVDGHGALRALAAARASGAPFHLALLDWHMPDFNGLALAMAIRALPAIADTPLIMLSSAEALPSALAMEEARFSALLQKPIGSEELLDALQPHLAGRELPREKREAAPRPGGAAPERPRLSVLVVDDNSANQLVAVRILEKLGHAAEVANNGQGALAMLCRQTYDVVLMDCQMPVMNGYETTRRIRAGTAPVLNPDIPIIALTAYALTEDRQKCLSAGMDDYVTKPVRCQDISDAFSRCGLVRAPLPPPEKPRASQPPFSGPGVFDPARREQLMKLPGRHTPSLWPELANALTTEIPRRLAELRQLVHEQRANDTGRSAHALAGSSANIGAAELRTAAASLERTCATGDWLLIAGRMHDVQAAAGRVLNALGEDVSRS